MTALKWITTEAKKIRRAHPRKYKNWIQYVKEASNRYARKHKPKARRKKVGARPGFKPVPAALPRYVRGIKTTSRTHTDKNKITANIQVGKKRRKRVGAKRVFKSNQRPGENYPLSWVIVKRDNKGFIKKGKEYVTLSPTFPRRIVWQAWEAKEAKAYLKKHCIKST